MKQLSIPALSRRDVLRKSGTASILLGLGLAGIPGSAAAMNKAELIEAMASESGLSKTMAKRAVDVFIDVTTKALENGESVTVVGFGLFDMPRLATRGKDTRTREESPVSFVACPEFAAALDLTPGKGEDRRNMSRDRCRNGDVVIDAGRLAAESETDRGTESGLSKADAKRALDAFINTTTKALKKGDRLSLVGFGSFSISKRSARTGRNPQTGKEIKIPAKNVVKFKAGAELSKAVN